MKTIYLIRHCAATGQAPGAELSEIGRQQAKDLAIFFEDKEIDHVISSPYIRAQHSIEPTALSKNLSLQIDDRLSERTLSTSDLPDWLDLLEQTFSDFDLTLTGGESSREATVRALEVVIEAPDNTALVTHGNLMSLILKHFDESIGFHEWKSLSNPDVYRISIEKDGGVFERLWK